MGASRWGEMSRGWRYAKRLSSSRHVLSRPRRLRTSRSKRAVGNPCAGAQCARRRSRPPRSGKAAHANRPDIFDSRRDGSAHRRSRPARTAFAGDERVKIKTSRGAALLALDKGSPQGLQTNVLLFQQSQAGAHDIARRRVTPPGDFPLDKIRQVIASIERCVPGHSKRLRSAFCQLLAPGAKHVLSRSSEARSENGGALLRHSNVLRRGRVSRSGSAVRSALPWPYRASMGRQAGTANCPC